MTKFCSKCKEDKDCSDFHKNRSEPDGLQTYCKTCFKEIRKAFIAKRKENPIDPPKEGLKQCSTCKLEKDVSLFYVNPINNDGLHYRCKACADIASAKSIQKRDPLEYKGVKQNWYQANRDLSIERAKNYRLDHPDWAKWVDRSANRSLFSKSWRVRNPEKFKQISQRLTERRRLTLLSMPINDLTPDEWQLILNTFDNACAYCGDTANKLTMDHVVPLIEGGCHTITNVVPACSRCNSRKQAKPVNLFLSQLSSGYYDPFNELPVRSSTNENSASSEEH